MASPADRYPENVPGPFYVDDQCIDCDACRSTAPGHFTRNDEGGYSFVHRQPTTPEETAACREALEGCPVEAIGDDGGDASDGGSDDSSGSAGDANDGGDASGGGDDDDAPCAS